MRIKNNPIEYSGEFDIYVGSKNYRFKNLLVNDGYTALFTYTMQSVLSSLRLGSGNAAPALANTAITPFPTPITISPVSRNVVIEPGTPNIVRINAAFEFTEPNFISYQIKELGLFNTALNKMVVRALPKDAGGNPITLTLPARGFFNGKYQLSLTMNDSDTSGNFTFNSVSYQWRFVNGVVRPAAGSLLNNVIFRMGVDAVSDVNMFALTPAQIQANLDTIYAGLLSSAKYTFTESGLVGVNPGSYTADRVISHQWSRLVNNIARTGCQVSSLVGNFPTGIASMFVGLAEGTTFKNRTGVLMFNPPLTKSALEKLELNNLIGSNIA